MLRSGSSVRTVRISSRYSVGAGISAGVSIAREASRRTCALAAPHAIPAPAHPISPADRSPKRYRHTGTAPDAIPRTAVSSPGAATPGRRLPPIRPPPKRTLPENTDAAPSRNLRTTPAPFPPPKRTPPENTDAAPSRNLRTTPAPIRPPRNEHCPKTQTQHRPVAPERRLSPIRPPKRTPPENTEAAPSRNLQTPPAPPIRPPKRTPPENTEAAPSRNLRTTPAPIRPPETNTARKHRRGTDPQPPPKKTQSSLPEQVPAGMTLIRRDVGRHHGTTG